MTTVTDESSRDEIENNSDELKVTLDPSSSTICKSDVKTRQKCERIDNQCIPDKKIRLSHKKINEKIIRCAIHCMAEYKISHADLSGIIVSVANTIFDQKWTMHSEVEENSDVRFSACTIVHSMVKGLVGPSTWLIL